MAARLINPRLARIPRFGPGLYLRATRALRDPFCEWEEVVERAASLAPVHLSVDVFDTVLTRTVANEQTVDRLVADRLVRDGLWPGKSEDYLLARRAAFQQGGEESLAAIYRRAPLRPITDAEVAIGVEIDIERSLSIPVPGAQNALHELRRVAQSLTFLSDMHLPTSAIEDLLDRADLLQSSDRVIVSGDASASKASGKLFAQVWTTRSLSQVFHLGNNDWADGARAAQAGTTPALVARANPTRYETAVSVDSTSFGPVIGGAARLARMNASPTGSPTENPEALGTQFLGITMMAFLLWVRRVCLTQGTGHTVFLARDGELPLRMAEAMPRSYWSHTELRYLHCGRRSWSVAAASAMGVAEWIEIGTTDSNAFLLHSAATLPFKGLLQRVGVDASQLGRRSPLYGLDLESPIPGADLQPWLAFLSDSTAHEMIEKESIRQKRLVVRWLRENLELGDRSPCLVDVGWRGQQSLMVSSLFREAFGVEPLHLHFGGTGLRAEIETELAIRRFAFDGDLVRPPIEGVVACMEMFLSAGGPRLLGYNEEDGKVQQVFSGAVEDVASTEIHEIWKGAVAVAEMMPPLESSPATGLQTSGDLAVEVRKLMVLLWDSPEVGEVKILERLRLELDDSGQLVTPIANAYSVREFGRGHRSSREWRGGSLAASPPAQRAIFKAIERLRRP